MSSSLKYVSSPVLRSKNINRTKEHVLTSAATTKSLHLLITTKLKDVTTNAQLLKRNCYRLSKGKDQQRQTVIGEIPLLNPIKGADKTRFLSSFHKYKNIMDVPAGIFKGFLDRFNGVTIDSSKEFNPDDNFGEKLKRSLDYWQDQKRRAIWFRVKSEHSEWVPHLTKTDFEFHYAKNGVVVLSRWLPKDEYPNLPIYAHTMLGVGGLVVNEKNEVLVVSERFALIPNSWKLPGGYAEPNENIIDAVIREVREETGIETIFNTVVSFRHSHGGIFGCSDIYCVVALTPTTLELQRCEREIAITKWMPCEEYLQHPNVHETNRHFLKCFLDYKKRSIHFTCELAQHQILKKDYCLYYMKSLAEKDVDINEQKLELGKV